jgi:hypothetical protein
MHVVLVEPRFPHNQRYFVRALAAVGATVTAIGEGSKDSLDPELKRYLRHYEEVTNVTDEAQLLRAVQFIQRHAVIDRLECTVEAHILPTARVREKASIAGTSYRTAWLCRDKPAMKDALRQAGVPVAQSTGASTAQEVRAFVEAVGFPVILKPRDGAGASGATRVDTDRELEAAIATFRLGQPGRSVAVEEFVEGHEGFYDTLSCNGRPVHDFVCHYYPNVLDAMRHRNVSPMFISTNRLDQVAAYDELRLMGLRVNEALGIETSATHMEWFYGPRGLKFSEIGCRPPGVRAWDLYNVGNDMDLYLEWAMLLVHGRPSQRPSRRLASGIVALRPDRDGRVVGIEGWHEMERRLGDRLIDAHFPHPGTPTQPVEAGYMANAWVRVKDENYDHVRYLLDIIGRSVTVRARA